MTEGDVSAARVPVPALSVGGEATTIWTTLEEWAAELTGWQRWMLSRAVQSKRLTDEDIESAYRLLLSESGLRGTDTPSPESGVAAVHRPSAAVAPLVRLKTLGKVRNVNALIADTALSFGDGMTMVYGANGCGKSGFARSGRVLHQPLEDRAAP